MKNAFLWAVGLSMLGISGLSCSKQDNDRIILRDVPERSETAQGARLATRTPSCPPAGIPPLQSSAPRTGHHKVTFTWNASPISSTSGNNAVGYCLYRSRKENAAKKNPTCPVCEQINVVPVAGLVCVDDLVEDSTTYYYVVTAINAAGRISPASNQSTVPIPSAMQIKSVPPGSQPPSCRAAAQPSVK